MTEKEKSLLAGCLSGEKAAWDSFVLEYSKLIYDTVIGTFRLYHVRMDESFIEDLHQDVFVALAGNQFHKLRQFKGLNNCTLASWLRSVTTRLTIDFLRKQKGSNVEISENFRSDQPDFAEALSDQEEQRLIQQTIDGLSARDKLLIDLHYRKGSSASEVAEIMNVSVSVVYTQKSRILSRLRETLKR